jgi:hypothetical protein
MEKSGYAELLASAPIRSSGAVDLSHRFPEALKAANELCRDLAERIAGRPVEIVWCTSWLPPLGRPAPKTGPPEELWEALDGSPFEGINIQKSSREERLRELFERLLGKDWDQAQVKDDMEGLGFDCGVWNRWGERALITTATPQFKCIGGVSELASAPSKPLAFFNLQINVTVKFAESGEPRGWQQIEVKAGEAHL